MYPSKVLSTLVLLLIFNYLGASDAANLGPAPLGLVPLPQTAQAEPLTGANSVPVDQQPGTVQFLQQNVGIVADENHEIDYNRPPKKTNVPLEVEIVPAKTQPEANLRANTAPVKDAVSAKAQTTKASSTTEDSDEEQDAYEETRPTPTRFHDTTLARRNSSTQVGPSLLLTAIILISTGLSYCLSLDRETLSV